MVQKLAIRNEVPPHAVSTIELPDGRYETIVFKGRLVCIVERYQTESEALRGHGRILEDVRRNPQNYSIL